MSMQACASCSGARRSVAKRKVMGCATRSRRGGPSGASGVCGDEKRKYVLGFVARYTMVRDKASTAEGEGMGRLQLLLLLLLLLR